MSLGLDLFARPSAILLCAAALSILLRRSSASMRHGMWILALISAVVLPLASTVVPRIDLPISPRVETSVTFLPVERPQESVGGEERGLKPATTYLTERVLWIVGVTFLLVRLVFGTIAVRRMTKTAVPLLEESWLHLIEELSVAFRLRRPLRLMISKQQIAPMTTARLCLSN